jgi:CRP/FNR family cyclic AMP-dependent transcriptional regulator
LNVTQDDYQVFRTNYLVSGLAEAAVKQLAELAEVHEAAQGSKLIAQDAAGNDLLVILKGQFDVLCNGEKIGEKGPGSVVGEVALLDNGTRSADVFAATAVTYAVLDGTTFRRFMAANHDAGFMILLNLSRVLTAALREATQQIEDLRGEARELEAKAD